MTAIARLRLAAYVRSYVAIAPTLAGLIVLALLYGGGRARPEEAYGVSALVLFPVVAWQVKILLDAEPDVQRRLVRVAAGADREIAAGLLAAAGAALPTIAIGLAMPWLLDGVTLKGSVGLGPALVLGLWAHVLSALAATVLGAWSSRAVSRSAGTAVSVLAGGSVMAIVLSLGPLRWFAPPLAPVARALTRGITAGELVGFTIWSLLWSAVVGAGYVAVRRSRS